MKNLKKMLFLAAMMVLATGFVFAGGSSQAGNTFTVAMSGDIRSLDPGLAWDYTTNQVAAQIAESLVTLDENNNIVPELAASWSQVDDVTYVYNVRNNVLFSDGSPMTMDDVLFSYERAKDPDGGTYFSDFFEEVDSFTVNGWQFTIKLKQPSAVFKYVPATGAGRIISKAYYQKKGKSFGSASGGIIATGPFVYQKWTSGREVVLKKNTNYWNKERLAGNLIDTLVFKIIPDDTTRVAALQRGDADFCVNVPTDMLDQLNAHKDLTTASMNSFHLTYLALNTQRAPMNDVNVRKAISRALNIPEFQQNIIKGAGTAGTILPFGPSLYNENAAGWQQYLSRTQGYTYDLAAARQHLSRSAYPNGFNADLIVNRQNSLALQRALYIQEALKAININVNVKGLTGGEQDEYHVGNARDANGFRDYDMLIGGWEADYPDSDCNIRIMYVASQGEAGGYNAAAYGTPQVESLITAQRATIDPARRFQIQTQLMDIIVNDVPYIIFDYSVRYSVLNKKYTNLAITPSWLWTVPIQDVRLAN
jgi:peptide/nickel transport system substrate-binding protein